MRIKRLILSATLSSMFVLTGLAFFSNNDVSALSGSQFKAGRIIADDLFYTGSAMSKDQIQSFLNSKVPNCDTNGQKLIYDSRHGDTVTRKKYSQRRGISTPFICLKNKTQSTPSRSANSQCSSYTGGTKSAAKIINDVAKACKISQKAMLVLLQKEQSLVTDDWPWPIQYRSATGYGCPDTAACDSEYYGFFNQVYNAARQFNRYQQNPNNYGHIPFRVNSVRYNPKSSCGSKSVDIKNFATAGLYNYTPYTPNQAALNNLYGTGNSCSAYGNRNFWRMYSDWFGSTLRPPVKPNFLSGDFNGDNIGDLALRRVNDGSIYIRYGNGSGSFSSEDIYSWAAGKHFATLAGDFNGDGDSDLALRRYSTGEIYIRYGNGSGSFDGQTNYRWAAGKHFQVIASDFNGDGDDDIALRRTSTGEIYIRYGNGSGSFDGQTNYRWAAGKHFQALGERFNNNNREDLALRRVSTGEIYIRYGNGSGSFDGQTNYNWPFFY